MAIYQDLPEFKATWWLSHPSNTCKRNDSRFRSWLRKVYLTPNPWSNWIDGQRRKVRILLQGLEQCCGLGWRKQASVQGGPMSEEGQPS